MTARSREAEVKARKALGLGSGLCIVAGIVLVMSFMNRPPKYEALQSSEAQLTKKPYRSQTGVERLEMIFFYLTGDWRTASKNHGAPAIDLDGKRVWLATGFGYSRSVHQLSQLAEGDTIRVWVSEHGNKKVAWHAAFNHRTVLDYDVIFKRDEERRHFFRLLALGAILVGIVLFYFRI